MESLKSPLFSRVCFILARPSHPGNIGSAARAIKTMGFTDLRVVLPKVGTYREHPDAIAMATSSVDVLQASRSYASLTEALSDVGYAFALTGYSRKYGPPFAELRESVRLAHAWLSKEPEERGRIAFVFGNERSGMTNEEIDSCQACSAIPANPASPSLNLSQAVQVTGYEMQMELMAATDCDLYGWQRRFDDDPPASPKAMEGLYAHWQEAMVACGALDPKEPKHMMDISRRMFSRAQLSQSEVDMLRGVCSAIILPRSMRIGRKQQIARERSLADKARNAQREA